MSFDPLIKAIKTPQGRISLILIAAGIIIASVVGSLFKNESMASFITLAGSIISLIGTQNFCSLIIQIRDSSEE